MRGANIDSNYLLVKATIRARISNIGTLQQKKRKKLNTEALKNKATALKFTEHVEQILEEDEQKEKEKESIVEQKWDTCAKTLITAAERTIDIQWRNINDDWFDEECREATRRKNEAYLIV